MSENDASVLLGTTPSMPLLFYIAESLKAAEFREMSHLIMLLKDHY